MTVKSITDLTIVALIDRLAAFLSRDEVFLIAVTIAKLPSVPRQILKDIYGSQIQPAGTIERQCVF